MSRWCVPAPALRKGGAPASPLYNDCMEEVSLEELLDSVRAYPGFERKKAIGHWARRFVPRGRMGARVYGPGDDAGAVELPGGGYLLLAGEGLWAPLLDDPEFAGFCSVTVNVNDIYAMGGLPLGLVSIIFSGGLSEEQREGFLDGLEQALEHYGVPLLGGHPSPEGRPARSRYAWRARRTGCCEVTAPGRGMISSRRSTWREKLTPTYTPGILSPTLSTHAL